jgi:uncharacterized membrane protein
MVSMTERMQDERVTPSDDERELRQRAIKRLEDRRGLMAHAMAYVLVNLLLVAIWYTTGATFFWPVFPIFGWGIGLAFHAWAVLWPAAGEARIQEEMERLRHSG